VAPDGSVPPSPPDFEAAAAIARRTADEAIWSGPLCAFHGASAPPRLGEPAIYLSFGGDLYEGSAGIARFLALAAELTGEETLRRTALGAARHALARAEGWSLFSGRLGAGLAALEVAERLGQADLVPSAVEAVEAASELALREAGDAGPYDLLGGISGVICGLLAAMAYDVDGGWQSRAFDLGRALLRGAVDDGTGWSWPVHPDLPERLCGLAHGASGSALALEALGRLAPDEPGWSDAAAKARGFERAWYAPEQGSWADLRSEVRSGTGGVPVYPHMWCHGSVGIAAERLALLGTSDTLGRADAVAGVAGAAAEAKRILAGACGPGGGDYANASQCHGLSGMAELFIDAWAIDAAPEWIALARASTAFMRNDARRLGGWRCGIPGGPWTPGLMLGGAGIGWAHFRAWNPAVIGSCWRLSLRAA
jgi:lantibiotic modifying enzyme